MLIKKIGLIFLVLSLSSGAFGQTKAATATVKIYFGNEKLDKADVCDGNVFPVTRQIPKTSAVAKATLEELFKGPTRAEAEKGYHSYFSDATKDILISIKVKNGAAYVNFKNEIVEKLGNATASCSYPEYDNSITKTLKQFPTIRKIFFAIEGKPEDYYDWNQEGECPKELKNCSGKDF
jgi:spore germination protein GerM